MRRLLSLAVVLGAAWAAEGRATAQAPFGRPPGPAPVLPPVYSPYLNLLRRDNSTVQNYYGLVRPEIEFRGAVAGLQQQITAVGQEATTAIDAATGLPYTGHPTQFLNTSHYFLNRGGQGLPAAPAAPAAPPRAALPTAYRR
jgi:hypothetical protein